MTKTTLEIIEQTARAHWKKANPDEDCPAYKTPTEAELIDFAAARIPSDMPNNTGIRGVLLPAICPRKALAEASRRLQALFPDHQGGAWNWLGVIAEPIDGPIGLLLRGLEHFVDTNPLRLARIVSPINQDLPPESELAVWWNSPEGYFVATLQDIWAKREAIPKSQRPGWPLGPIVAAWQKKPQPIQAEDRKDPIFPASLVMVKNEHRQGRLFSMPAHTRPTGRDGAMYLPGFAPGEPDGGPITPALPLALYDLGVGQYDKSHRVSSLALRLFVEPCLSVPLDKRGHGPVLLPPERFGDFLKRLYPAGAKNWNHRQLGPLLAAFAALESPQARIPWQDPKTGRGGARRVVIPRDIPRSGRLDDWVQFAVDLPPGGERGPLVDRPALIKFGATSATQYRLALSLSFHWYDPGRIQYPIAKGGPWRLSRDGRQYPEVSDEELVAMAFPAGGQTRFRGQLYRAKKALEALIEEGFVLVASQRRIYPGGQWAGWGEQPPS